MSCDIAKTLIKKPVIVNSHDNFSCRKLYKPVHCMLFRNAQQHARTYFFLKITCFFQQQKELVIITCRTLLLHDVANAVERSSFDKFYFLFWYSFGIKSKNDLRREKEKFCRSKSDATNKSFFIHRAYKGIEQEEKRKAKNLFAFQSKFCPDCTRQNKRTNLLNQCICIVGPFLSGY